MATSYQVSPYFEVFPRAMNAADAWTVIDGDGHPIWRDPQASIPMIFRSELAARQAVEHLNASGAADGPV